jgi:hypothetical protein
MVGRGLPLLPIRTIRITSLAVDTSDDSIPTRDMFYRDDCRSGRGVSAIDRRWFLAQHLLGNSSGC